MVLSELISVDNRFEKSVNLLLDLNDPAKLKYYIPTRSSVNVLKEYLKNVVGFNGNRADLLIGPYGRGKSHLFLVLMAVLGQENSKELKALTERIVKVDPSMKDLIRDVRKNCAPILPVILNPGSGSLAESVLKCLSQTLKREKITDVVPDNYYTEAARVIETWKSDYPDAYAKFEEKLGSSAEELEEKLNHYEESALEEFRRIYPAVTFGSEFHPVVEEDVIGVLRSVNHALAVKHGYKGMYLIFDEFSKYIEGHSGNGFSADMKTLQDICELCNASRDEQLHFTCIAHKNIKAYRNSLPEDRLNAFRGVEGRLNEVYFVVSSQNNYELIADAITKKKGFEDWLANDSRFAEVTDLSYETAGFRSLFDRKDFQTILAEGCYPLTPIAAMILLGLSEKIGQNERSLFTFISGKQPDSLTACVKKTNGYVGADRIYDYFVPLFREDEQQSIHHEWLKADYALGRTSDEEEQKLVKALALIRMLQREDDIPATENFISLSCAMEEETFRKASTSLIQSGILEFRGRNKTYEFKNNVGVDVEVAIADVIAKHYMKADVFAALNGVMRQKCILPKKHNQTYQMTRYFNIRLISEEQFQALRSMEYLEWENEPDGVLLVILPEQEMPGTEITGHLKVMGEKTATAAQMRMAAGYEEIVKRLLAVRNLQGNRTFTENNAVLVKELSYMEENLTAELNEDLMAAYRTVETVYTMEQTFAVKGSSINRIVSDICDAVYDQTPVINHELINRHVPTPQIKRARKILMETIFYGRNTEAYLTETSAEATIYRAVMVRGAEDLGVLHAKRVIRDFFLTCVGKKQGVASLIASLTKAPVGMRKGIIPFLLMEELLGMEDMPVIYQKTKEITIDPDTICSMVEKPESYSLYVEQETVQKDRYIDGLEELFGEYGIYCKDIDARNRMAKVACLMQSWYRSLPQASQTWAVPEYEGQDVRFTQALCRQLKGVYINPREILLDRIPKAAGSSDLEEVLERMKTAKQEIDGHIHWLKEQTAGKIRRVFGLEEGANLALSLKEWYESLPEYAKSSILSTDTAAALTLIRENTESSEEEIAGRFGKTVLHSFVEDWKDDSVSRFEENLTEIYTEIVSQKAPEEDSQKVSVRSEDGKIQEMFYDFDMDAISTSGQFFKNALSDVLDEYGDALDNKEKIGILMAAIRDLVR